MLYNPEWEKQDVFSNASLVRWLQRQPGQYIYQSCSNCLLAQYFQAMGMEGARVTSYDVQWWDGGTQHREQALPEGWDYVARGSEDDYEVCPFASKKFSDALTRARQLDLVC